MNLRVLTVPYDTALRDYRMGAGPARLLAAGLRDSLESAGHAVLVEQLRAPDESAPAEIRTAFELNRVLAERVRAAVEADAIPVVLAGNCITSLGTLAGLHPRRCGVVWFDSHGDFNTPSTSSSGFLDGMAVATLTGRCWQQLASAVDGHHPVPDEDVLLLGTRDLDALEQQLLSESGVKIVPPTAIRSDPAGALDVLRERVTDVYVHLDLDVLDPSEMRANAFAAPDGLRISELRAALGRINVTFTIRAIALTAYDPAYDPDGKLAGLAIELLEFTLSGHAGNRDHEPRVERTRPG